MIPGTAYNGTSVPFSPAKKRDKPPAPAITSRGFVTFSSAKKETRPPTPAVTSRSFVPFSSAKKDKAPRPCHHLARFRPVLSYKKRDKAPRKTGCVLYFPLKRITGIPVARCNHAAGTSGSRRKPCVSGIFHMVADSGAPDILRETRPRNDTTGLQAISLQRCWNEYVMTISQGGVRLWATTLQTPCPSCTL